MSLEDLWDLPADDDPVVVPASPVTVGGRRVPALQLRQVRAGGERVGLAFTSPQRLVAVLGPWQPWLGLLMGAYAQWLASAGVTRVHVDPVYADDVSTWTSSALVDAARGGEGYSAAAVVYEAGHEGHWTDHISKDGWVLGLGEGVGDTAKAEWNNDVIGVGGKIIDSVEHPQQAAAELWHGITSW